MKTSNLLFRVFLQSFPQVEIDVFILREQILNFLIIDDYLKENSDLCGTSKENTIESNSLQETLFRSAPLRKTWHGYPKSIRISPVNVELICLNWMI